MYARWIERLTDLAIATFLWSFRLAVVFIVVVGSALTIADGRYTMATYLSLVMTGLTLGSIYALVALGYTMVYGILRMINFAHGEVFMAGSFGGYFTAIWLRDAGILNAGLLGSVASLLLMFAAAMTISVSIALMVERIAYRPLRNAPRLVPLISAIGASFFLQYTFRGFLGPGLYAYPGIGVLGQDFMLVGVRLRVVDILVVVAAVVMMAILYTFVMRSRTGTAIRAVSEDKATAALMGINVDRSIVMTFALGAAMAGAGGVLYGLLFQNINFFTGFFPGLKAFTSAVLGGIGNIPGAMLGGLFLGQVESIGPTLFLEGLRVPATNQLKDVIAFTMLVLVLIFRPSGILGERLARQRA
jgi:branched-chain amino acid transport system permease protein